MDTNCIKTHDRAARYVSGAIAGGLLGLVLGALFAKVWQESVSVYLCAVLGACIGMGPAAFCFLERRLTRSLVARIFFVVLMVLNMSVAGFTVNLVRNPQATSFELFCTAIPLGVFFGVFLSSLRIAVALSKNADE